MSDEADPKDRTQLYLITPAGIDPETFPDRLAAVLDAVEIACLRLRLGSQDADAVARAADAVRLVAHERDVPFVVEKHLALAERLGLDGVHLEGTRNVRKARETLGEDAIAGTYCGTSRHDGMTAGEAGADYVSFGPVADAGLGEEIADLELFSWWSDMIELPVVAEGAVIGKDGDRLAKLRELAPITDFIGLGDDLWACEDPAAMLREIDKLLG